MKEIELLLEKESVPSYKKAAKLIEKHKAFQYGDKLLSFLEESLNDPRRWEISCNLIEVLGKLKYQNARDLLHSIIEENKKNDLVTMKAATAYIRILRNDLSDVRILIDLLKSKSYSVKEGALEALGYDRMVPSIENQNDIITLMWDFGLDRDKRGYSDPRYGLAAACAGWKSEKVMPFLNHCLKTGDTPLIHVAEKAKDGKYVRLR